MGKVRGPIRYVGGKFYLVKYILPYVPLHKIYVEVFGGGAQLLFAKPPSPVEVYNDVDERLVTFFRVLRDKEKFEELYRRLYLTPFSRQEFYYCRDNIDKEEDEIEKARMFFVITEQSFAGNLKTWGYSIESLVGGMAQGLHAWLSKIESLPEVVERLKRVQIENYDFRKIFEIYDTEDTFFYCDPPYIQRNKEKYYRHLMSLEDHQDLVKCLLDLKGKAILSGFDHEVYKPLEENGWKKIEVNVVNFAMYISKRKLKKENESFAKANRVEYLWISPNIPIPEQVSLLEMEGENEKG